MRNLAILVAAAVAVLGANTAFGIPLLQIYMSTPNGPGIYDADTDTWIVSGGSDGGPVQLWVIGNISGPGGAGTIYDVHLSVAYDKLNPETGLPWNPAVPVITLTPRTTGDSVFTDTSVPQDPTYLGLHTDGSAPTLTDGSPLPSHGIFGPDKDWQEFFLGDFDAPPDSPVADFINTFPTAGVPGGQINVYDVSVGPGFHGLTLHFDAYNHVQAKQKIKYIFTPFSHDGEGGADGEQEVVPEPSAIVLCSGLAMMGLISARRRRKIDAAQPA